MTASRHRFPGRDGFTLIELTLVTLLVLVLAGLSTPLFKRTLSDLSAKNVSFSICKLMDYAQETAVLKRVNYKISFDFKAGKYQLLELSSSVKPPKYVKVTGRFGKLFGLPQGLKLSGDKSGIIFYPDGRCDEIKVNVLTSTGGYSIVAKGFGNMARIKEVNIEQ